MATFADRLKMALEIRKISAAELSRRLGVDEGTISNYKKGKYEPKQRRTDAISNILNVSVAWLMGADVPMEKESNPILPDNILPLPATKLIPLVGTIACGKPIFADENIEYYIKSDEKLSADFALRCKGDSMINSRIYDGDIVYIRKQPDVDNGEIAAVLIGEEATLKKVYKYPNKVVLRASNPLYDDIICTDSELENITILGKAVAFLGMVK